MTTSESSSPDLCKWDVSPSGTDEEELCQRSPVEESAAGLCRVHDPGIDLTEKDVKEQIQSEHGLAGCRVQELDLSEMVPQLESNQALNLSGSSIETLRIDNFKISSSVDLSDANIDRISAEKAEVEGSLDCRDLECKKIEAKEFSVRGDFLLEDGEVEDLLDVSESQIESLDATNLRVEGKLSLADCQFDEQVILDSVEVDGETSFQYSTFESRVSIQDGTFQKSTDFSYTNFESAVTFDETVFQDESRFTHTHFGPHRSSFVDVNFQGPAIFNFARSSGVLSFSPNKEQAELDPSKFDASVKFIGANAHIIDLSGANVERELCLDDTTVDRFVAEQVTPETLRIHNGVFERRFVLTNATCGELDTTDTQFGGPSDLVDITVKSVANIEHATFDSQADFSDATFRGDVKIEQSSFSERVNFDNTDFEGRSFFSGTRFEGPTTFENATFIHLAWFTRREPISAPPVVFSNEVTFDGAHIGAAVFSEVIFEKTARFDGAWLGAVDHRELPQSVKESTHVSEFRDEELASEVIDLDDTDESEEDSEQSGSISTPIDEHEEGFDTFSFKNDWKPTRQYRDGSRGQSSEIPGQIRLEDLKKASLDITDSAEGPASDMERELDSTDDTQVDQPSNNTQDNLGSASPAVWFDGVAFDGYTSFNNCIINDSIVFHDTSFNNVRWTSTTAMPDAILDFRETRLESGNIDVATTNGEKMWFVFSNAALRGVSLNSSEESLPVFSQCRIKSTTFEGFNFLPHLPELRDLDWRIDHLDSSASDRNWVARHVVSVREGFEAYLRIWRARNGKSQENSADDSILDLMNKFENLRTTYQYAKSGANATGQNEPASEFFQHEMRNQVRHHAAEALAKDTPIWKRLYLGLRVAVGAGFGIFSKYGESGARVVLWSLFVVLAMAGFYWLRPNVGQTGADSLTFSLGSFAGLLVGGFGTQATGITALAASIQGFTGAFLIALLVFTLTRSVQR